MPIETVPGWRGRARRLLPFASIVALTFALSVIHPHLPDTVPLLVGAGCCFVLVAVMVIAVPWERLPPLSALVVVVCFCLGVALLRDSGGGGQSGYAPLLLLPIIWHALYGRRVDLGITVGAVAATLAIPIVAIGGAAYPATQWRNAVLFMLIGGALGVIVQTLTRTNAALAERLAEFANLDALTGLPNRRAWDAALAAAVTDAIPTATASVALIDLDHFKIFNDSEGHVEADNALRSIAAQWSGRLGPDAVLARWGGEEFALLLPNTDPSTASTILRDLAAAMPHGITFSAGLATVAGQTTVSIAMATVDELLYLAKDSGRACVASSPVSALMSGGGTLDGQPVIDHIFETKAAVSAEWLGPTHSPVAPSRATMGTTTTSSRGPTTGANLRNESSASSGQPPTPMTPPESASTPTSTSRSPTPTPTTATVT